MNNLERFCNFMEDLATDVEFGPLARIMLVLLIPLTITIPYWIWGGWFADTDISVIIVIGMILKPLVMWIVIAAVTFMTLLVSYLIAIAVGWIVKGELILDMEEFFLEYTLGFVAMVIASGFIILFCKSKTKDEWIKKTFKPNEAAKDVLSDRN